MGESEKVVVRAPNHLGDLVMALPALAAVPGADVLVARSLTPLLALAPGFAAVTDGEPGRPFGRRIIPLDRGRSGMFTAAGELRRRRYSRGVLLTPSFSSALLFVMGGVRARRGTATDGRAALLTDRISEASLAPMHRAASYLSLVTGEAPAELPVPRLEIPGELGDRWREMVGDGDGPTIGLFPGSNASSRRWDPDRFAAVARRLTERGARVVVFGGPGEREITAAVAGDVALDLAGRTDLPLLAAGLAACDLLVTNDTGPMHLAAAVGTRTLSLQGASDPRETRPLGDGHVLLQRADLPCVPCVKNECPRRGRGYVLPEAERECLRLIEVDEVLAAIAEAGIPSGDGARH